MVSDAALENYQVEVAEGGLTRGNIYRGVIANLQPALNAAFVDYGAAQERFPRHPGRGRRGALQGAAAGRPRPDRRPAREGQADRRPGPARPRGPEGRGAHHQSVARRPLPGADALRRHPRRLAQGRGRRDAQRAQGPGRQARAAARLRRDRAHQRARPDPRRAAARLRGPAAGLEADPDRGPQGLGRAPPLQRPGPDPEGPARPPRRLGRRGAGRRRRRLPAGARVHAGLHAALEDPARALRRAGAAVLEVRRREPDRAHLQPRRAAAPAAARSSSTRPRR